MDMMRVLLPGTKITVLDVRFMDLVRVRLQFHERSGISYAMRLLTGMEVWTVI